MHAVGVLALGLQVPRDRQHPPHRLPLTLRPLHGLGVEEAGGVGGRGAHVARRGGLGRHLVLRGDGGERVDVAGTDAGGDHGRGGGQVVAEGLRERRAVPGQEPHRLQRADGRQPDPAPARSDGHAGVHGGALDGVVDHAGDALVGVVDHARLRVVAGPPHDAVVAVEHREPDAGAGRHTLDREQRRVVQVERALLAPRQLDVPAERRERRGVLPHVERRVDVGAQDDPALVAARRPGADRQGEQARRQPTSAAPVPIRTSLPWVLFTGVVLRP